MKQEILKRLDEFKKNLRNLKIAVSAIPGDRINRIAIRKAADALATEWVEQLRVPLETKFNIPLEVMQSTSEYVRRLHVLSRPNNLKDSYLKTIKAILYKFDNKFILPIKQTSFEIETAIDLQKLIQGLEDLAESDYFQEAINCATSGYRRAAIVMGWCATVDKIQKKILALGLNKFNSTSKLLKNQSKGKFKNWNKEYNFTTFSELQTVFDTDLIVVLEGIELIDGNQVERLKTCFQYRNHSAHPGNAPIEETHLLAFFTDICAIILQNPKFKA